MSLFLNKHVEASAMLLVGLFLVVYLISKVKQAENSTGHLSFPL